MLPAENVEKKHKCHLVDLLLNKIKKKKSLFHKINELRNKNIINVSIKIWVSFVTFYFELLNIFEDFFDHIRSFREFTKKRMMQTQVSIPKILLL